MKSTRVKIDEKLYFNIYEYCKINNLKIEEYVNTLLKKNFMIDKYGDRPAGNITTEVQKEPIRIPSVSIEEIVEETTEQTFENDAVYTSKEKITEAFDNENDVSEVAEKKSKRKLK